LGVQDLGAPTMFSNLRVFGGNNHLFLPAGWLQNGGAAARPAWLFDGGLVRVEATNSTWIRDAVGYPGDHSEELTPTARALLRQVGSDGSQDRALTAS
jgi:hypothetical protein